MIQPLTLRSLGSLLMCDGEWHRAGPETVHIYEPLDTGDVPADAEAYAWGVSSVRFWYPCGVRSRLVNHQRVEGDLVLLDDDRWYEIVGGQAVRHNGEWCMRWRGARNTRLARMLNAAPPKLGPRRVTLQEVRL